MLWLDLILILVLMGFMSWGSYVGFVQVVVRAAGLIASVFLALGVYDWLLGILPGIQAQFWGQIIAFFVVLVFVTKLVSLLVGLLEGVFRVVSIIPFTKTLNRMLGLLLGLLLGAVVIGAFIFVAASAPVLPEWIAELMRTSRIAKVALFIVGVAGFLFPDALDRARSVFVTA